MNTQARQNRRTPWSGAFFSPRYFWARAVALGIFFLMAHFAGLREYTTFVTGTTGDPDVGFRTSAFYGMIYLTLYMGCVVLAPILIIASALLKIWERFNAEKSIVQIAEHKNSNELSTAVSMKRE